MNFACKEIRKDILNVSYVSRHGHIPTCFSVVEMLYATYQVMKHDPKNPNMPDRDIFILSKGHAALAHYCILAKLGYFPIKEVEQLGTFQSRFGCHEDRFKTPGVEVSTGSLGHGIGVGVGMALAFKLQKSGRKVFALIGDGESNEGSVWEAVMVASNLQLTNFTVLYDDNQSQTRCLQIRNPAEKFLAFGCEVFEVDGHNLDELAAALSRKVSLPKVIVAHTQKGFGCETFAKDKFAWHRRSPSEEEFKKLMKELDA